MNKASLCCSGWPTLILALAGAVFLVVPRVQAGQLAQEQAPAAKGDKTSSSQDPPSKDADEDPGDAYRELLREYQLAQEEFVANARLNKGVRQRNAPEPPLHEFAGRFIDFARRNATDPWAVEALVWITTNARESQPQTARTWKQAIEILERDHAAADALYLVVKSLEGNLTRSLPAVRFLRAVADRNPNGNICGQACYSLAQALMLQLDIARQLRGPGSPKAEKSLQDSLGKEFVEQLKQEDPEKIAAEIVQLLERVRDKYAEYGHARGSLGEAAIGDLFEIQHLGVGKVAPPIEGKDLAGKPFQLDDYRGKVVLLIFIGHWGREFDGFYQHVAALEERLRHKSFALLGVNSDINAEPMREGLEAEDIRWRMWRDGGPRGPIATSWNIHPRPGIIGPRIFVLDHNGRIRYRDVFRSELDEAVDGLLAEWERDPAARAAAAKAVAAIPRAAERRARKIRPYGSRAYYADGISLRAFAFHGDGKSLVTAGWDRRADDDLDSWKAGTVRGDLRLLNVADRSEIGRFDGEVGGVMDVAVAPDGKWIATAGRTLGTPGGGEVRTWDVETRKPIRTLLGHKGWVLSVAISPDGTRIASGSFDRTVRIWDAASGREVAVLPHPSTPGVVCYSGDGKTLAAGCRGGSVKLWNTDTWQERASFDVENLMLHSMDLSSDGALVVVGGLRSQNGAARSDDGILTLLDAATGAQKFTILPKSAVTGLAFSRDRKYLVAAGHTSSIIDTETGAVVATIRRQMSTSEDKIAFTPDGKSLAIADSHRVDVWDVRGLSAAEDDGKENDEKENDGK